MEPLAPVLAQQNQIGISFSQRALKIGGLTAIGVISAIAQTSIIGELLLEASSGYAFYWAVSHLVKTLNQDVPAFAQKVDRVFNIVMWTGLIAGAVSVGCGAGLLISSGSALINATSTFEAVNNLTWITYVIGYSLPFGKWLLLNFNHSNDTIREGLRTFAGVLKRIPNLNVLQRINLFIRCLTTGTADNTIDIEILEHFPEDTIKEYFHRNVLLLSNEKIGKLIEKYPTVLTYSFLFKTLSQNQVADIMMPILNKGMDNLKNLDVIEEDLKQWYSSINSLDEESLNEILDKILNHVNTLRSLVGLIRKLPDVAVSHQLCQTLITQLKKERERIKYLYTALTDISNGSLRKKIADIAYKAKENTSSEDLSEEAYITLCAQGVRVADFKEIVSCLGLSKDKTPFEAVSDALNESGIETRGDLKNHNISTFQDVITFLKASNRFPKEAPKPSTWRQVARIASHIFAYASSGALIGFQIYHQPYWTALGLGFGMTYPIPQIFHRASPDEIERSVQERCRELNRDGFFTLEAVRMGKFFAMIGGAYHANTIKCYARPWIRYIQLLVA